MTLPERDLVSGWIGRTVEDEAGAVVGSCTAVYVDDATGLPEWALLEAAGHVGLRFLPLVGAREHGEVVRVPFSAGLIDTAPRVGSQEHLTEDEEVALYRHYGVQYSQNTSSTVLPAAAAADHRELAEPRPAVPAAETAERETLLMGTAAPEPRVARSPEAAAAPAAERGTTPWYEGVTRGASPAAVGGIAAGAGGGSLVAAALWWARRRRARPEPPLVGGARSAGATLGSVAGVVEGVADAAGSELLRVGDRVSEVTLRAAADGARTATEAAETTRATVTATVRRLRRSWRRTASGVTAVIGTATGYLLGAQAGEARYAQLRSAAGRIAEHPAARRVSGGLTGRGVTGREAD